MGTVDYDFGTSGYETNSKDYADDYGIDVGSTDYTTTAFEDFGTGTSGNEHETTAYQAYVTAMSTLQSSVVEAQGAYDAACEQSRGAVEAAYLDASARCYEADQTLAAVTEQCNTDEQVAMWEYEVEMAKNETELESIKQVDAVNAQANLVSANALMVEANAEQTEADAEADEAKYKYLYDDDSVW